MPRRRSAARRRFLSSPVSPGALARCAAVAFVLLLSTSAIARASDQIYFPAVDNTLDRVCSVPCSIVQLINAETVRIDISAWYLTEHLISEAIVARKNAGVPVRVIGDRGAIFDIDPNTKTEFYYLANAGVPIRLRYNPTWFPEIDHMKMAIFKGQGVVEFGSANWTTFQLKPASSTNYGDETVMITDDPVLVGAFETRFDQTWNDTTRESQSIYGGPPYLVNWYDACPPGTLESACSDFPALYPNPAPMIINTARLEPDNPTPSDLIWGQGRDFNRRLVTEINNENSSIRFVIYRLTINTATTIPANDATQDITQALLNRRQAGVPIQIIIEPNEYMNRRWPEFWLTHANMDRLWVAGIPIKQRAHQGITHMKMLVTSSYATNASSNYSVAWQRDNDYFVPAATKPTIYKAMSDRFNTMWNDTTGFTDFVPQPADAAALAAPANTSSSISTTPTFTWNTAAFAVSYDVYLGTSPSGMVKVGNVPAVLTGSPPSTYSFTPSAALQGGTTYYWQVVSRTYAADVRPSLLAPSAMWSFTTGGSSSPPPPPPPSSSVPSPWATTDVGAVTIAGSATYSAGVFTVSGSGADIWGTSDAFRFVYQPLSGDGQIVARLTGMQNTSSVAKAGIMFRETTASNATFVVLDRNPSGTIEFMARAGTGTSVNWLAGSTLSTPGWLKLVRSGSTVTGYVSGDGSTWVPVGSTTVAMAAGVQVGLLVCSHNTSTLNTSTFDNVAAAAGGSAPPPPPPSSALPSPWTNRDVGSVAAAGSASFSNGIFTVTGSGADIWGTSDAFQYVYQSLAGDGQIVARMTGMQNTSSVAKAGVMLRETTGAGASFVMLDANPNGNIEFMARSGTGSSVNWLGGATQAAPSWLRLSRSGSTFTAAVSANGSTWTPVGSTTVSMASNILVGLIVCSHSTALNTSTFDNVSVGGTTTAPPPPSSATNVVIYASDIPAASIHGAWSAASDSTAAAGVKLITPDNGFTQLNNPLASPTHYVDVTFNANAGTPYTIWLRMQSLSNVKSNDSLWVQFSDAQAGGAPVYAINTTTGLLVNLATDGTGSSLNGWGWQNHAYWLSQPTTITFATSGAHTLRIQVREDGVQFDQIVLSPTTYLNSAPGRPTADSTIVPK